MMRKCQDCGRLELPDEKEEWIEIDSKPDENFVSRRLALFCPSCGKRILEQFRREYGQNAAIEC